MSEAWYTALSMIFGYFAAAIALLVVVLSLRKSASDAALLHRVRRNLPESGCAGHFRVLSAEEKWLRPGRELPVPYEGTLGSFSGCDIVIPVRGVHGRSAFFWIDDGLLHIAALHSDGFLVDDEPIESGDEAILEDGAILSRGNVTLRLNLAGVSKLRELDIGPYVTGERLKRASDHRNA